jgi:hypothetical protein
VTLTRAIFCLSLAALLVSCDDQPRPEPSLGDAYVGPSRLNLRQELGSRAAISATVKHGDKLAIIQYRHRLVKVRTPQGAEGWTDARQLLMPEQMDLLRDMAKEASRYPSQGVATVFESLNMHTEPNRAAPSFWQIPENGKVDVIGHKLMPRVQRAESTPVAVKPATVRKRAKSKPTRAKVGPPPRPPAPKLPGNWVALSVPKLEPEAPPQPPPPPPAPAPVGPMDDWSLVRTPDGKAGWALTRPLIMAIPDEVAQYAEGHRITSYFALGQVHDGDLVKNNWLWTTIIKGREPYEFDSFRVFVWSLRHHRYETAYIERNVVGHYPVLVDKAGAAPSFSLVLEGGDGNLYRRTYSFEGYRIKMVNKEPYSESAQLAAKAAVKAAAPERPVIQRSWYARLKDRVHRIFR